MQTTDLMQTGLIINNHEEGAEFYGKKLILKR